MNGTTSPATPGGALVLHGGGGPLTVAPLAQHLSTFMQVQAPTHPGWDGTPLPAHVRSIGDVAQTYLDGLWESGARDTVLVGSSIGGWIALDLAVRAGTDPKYSRTLAGIILLDTVGVDIPGSPIRDFFALTPRTLAEYAWHDSERGYRDPAALTQDQRRVLVSNGETMRVLAGDPPMHDPSLLPRLAGVELPVLVIWGASDRIVTPRYGHAVAEALPHAEFAQIPEAGHLPHLENPEATFAAMDAFLDRVATAPR